MTRYNAQKQYKRSKKGISPKPLAAGKTQEVFLLTLMEGYGNIESPKRKPVVWNVDSW